ncbi:MAG: hypothetical protein AAB481_01570 [Patescibacteria group bacterium]
MIEAATPSPMSTAEAPRAETTPSFLDQMGTSVRQFAGDVAKANEDAREQLGRTAVGHMISGLAPLTTGIIGDVVLEALLEKIGETKPDAKTSRNKPTPFSLLANVVNALEKKPFLREVAENVGITVAYNQLVARPSEGALPPASAVDAGIAVGLDAAAIGVENIAKTERVSGTITRLKGTGDVKSLRVRSVSGLKEGGKTVVHAITLANGPTVLGLRMMGEGVVAIAKNYKAIQYARSHPNEPKPYRPPERKPWDRGDRGPRRDFQDHGRDKMYYGQGGGRNDRYHR